MTDAPVLPFYAKVTLIIVGILGSLYLLYLGEEVIVPLIYALLISILLNPMVNFLIKKKVPKVIAITLAILVAIVFISGLVGIITVQVSMVARTYPQFRAKLDSNMDANIMWCAEKLHTNPDDLIVWLKNIRSQMTSAVQAGLGRAFLTMSNTIVLIILIPVYTFLILLYKSLLLEFIRKLFNPIHHVAVVEVLGSIKTVIQSYLVGLLIEGLIVATLNTIALFALGVEYALVLGITGAILNVIPYIGGLIAFALPMIVAFITHSLFTSLWVFVLYTIIQFIDNHYLIPYIVASKVRINALVAVIVVLIGNALWGIPGMFLAIPMTALLKIIFDHIDPLKPWGYVLGDDIPLFIKLPFLNPKAKVKTHK